MNEMVAFHLLKEKGYNPNNILKRSYYFEALSKKGLYMAFNKKSSIELVNKFKRAFLKMKETDFVEGGSLNSFGEKFDFEGKEFKSKMRYQMYGTNIDYLIDNKILDIPDYIKIDVDGIEHFLLQGGSQVLKKIQGILVEINDDFAEQAEVSKKLLEEARLTLLEKRHSEMFEG